MADNPRIEELRRRVEKDPASIAFAQLAEEYRRAGSYEKAIAVCRSGLETHPGYLSARVTLGRALLEIHDLDASEIELRYVLEHAPENLSAIRGLAEICHRRGDLTQALGFYQTALGLARHDPDLEQVVDEISRSISPAQPELITDGLSFEQATAEFLAALDESEAEAIAGPSGPSQPEAAPRPLVDPLERLLGHSPGPELVSAPDPVPEAKTILEPELIFESEMMPEPFLEAEPSQELEPALSFEADLTTSPRTPPPPPELRELERFLEAIHSDRLRRAV